MRFTWDEKKNLSNIKDHKISFVQAVYVFADPLHKEYYDENIAVMVRIGLLLLVWLKIVCYLSVLPSRIWKQYILFPPGKQKSRKGDFIMGTVSYTFETLPPVSKEEWERIDAVKDEDINYSDIPEMRDLSGLCPRQVRKLNAKKVPFSCNLDADIVEWLKRDGDCSQDRLNTILREAMVHGIDEQSETASNHL
jgi:uncharacterized protein (DUF4415 family)